MKVFVLAGKPEEVHVRRAFPPSRLSRNGDTLGCGGADMATAVLSLVSQATECSCNCCTNICLRLQQAFSQESHTPS